MGVVDDIPSEEVPRQIQTKQEGEGSEAQGNTDKGFALCLARYCGAVACSG